MVRDSAAPHRLNLRRSGLCTGTFSEITCAKCPSAQVVVAQGECAKNVPAGTSTCAKNARMSPRGQGHECAFFTPFQCPRELWYGRKSKSMSPYYGATGERWGVAKKSGQISEIVASTPSIRSPAWRETGPPTVRLLCRASAGWRNPVKVPKFSKQRSLAESHVQRVHLDVPLLWSYQRQVGGVEKIPKDSRNRRFVVPSAERVASRSKRAPLFFDFPFFAQVGDKQSGKISKSF